MATSRSTSVTVVIFDEVMYRGNGIVKNWCDKITSRFEREAVRACPKRTGTLASTIGSYSITTGPRAVEGAIYAGGPRAPYADFVMRGTTWPIMSDLAWAIRGGPRYDLGPHYLMPLPEHNGHKASLRYIVAGQDPNNFLFTAWDRTAWDHTSIRRTVPTHLANF